MDEIMNDVSEHLAANPRELAAIREHNAIIGRVAARAGARPAWRAFHRGSPAMGALVIHGREVVRHYSSTEAMLEWLRT
jgi:hypothetical protein